MRDSIDSRVVISGDITVTVTLYPDTDSRPEEFDCYSEADVAAWRADQWYYLGVEATVEWRGNKIGDDVLWSVEHGSLSEVECDAFDMTPGRTEGDKVIMGSPAWQVVCGALTNAQAYVSSVREAPAYLAAALQSIGADPGEPAPSEEAVRAARVILHTHQRGLTGGLEALRAMGVSESILDPAEEQERAILRTMATNALDRLDNPGRLS